MSEFILLNAFNMGNNLNMTDWSQGVWNCHTFKVLTCNYINLSHAVFYIIEPCLLLISSATRSICIISSLIHQWHFFPFVNANSITGQEAILVSCRSSETSSFESRRSLKSTPSPPPWRHYKAMQICYVLASPVPLNGDKQTK